MKNNSSVIIERHHIYVPHNELLHNKGRWQWRPNHLIKYLIKKTNIDQMFKTMPNDYFKNLNIW